MDQISACLQILNLTFWMRNLLQQPTPNQIKQILLAFFGGVGEARTPHMKNDKVAASFCFNWVFLVSDMWRSFRMLICQVTFILGTVMIPICSGLITVNALHAWTLSDVRFRYSREWFVNEFDWHAFAMRLKDKDHFSNNWIIQLKISRTFAGVQLPSRSGL